MSGEDYLGWAYSRNSGHARIYNPMPTPLTDAKRDLTDEEVKRLAASFKQAKSDSWKAAEKMSVRTIKAIT